MARVILYIFIFCVSNTYCNVGIQPKIDESNGVPAADADNTKQADVNKPNKEKEQVPEVIVDNIPEDEKPKEDKEITVILAATPETSNVNIKNNTNTDIEAGVVLRGVFVFVGITLLLIMYLTCKTYRKRNKKNVLIKKYGVKTRRTDVEMEPLPLDDDEEDETVFDLGNVNNR